MIMLRPTIKVITNIIFFISILQFTRLLLIRLHKFNSKDSTSNGDSDKSDSKSKSKSKDPNCLEDSTAALAALGEVTVNRCSGDAIPSYDDESQDFKKPMTATEQEQFEHAYRLGYAAVFNLNESTVAGYVHGLLNSLKPNAIKMGALYGIQQGLASPPNLWGGRLTTEEYSGSTGNTEH